MRIHLAESAGFCFGVNRAVEMVEQAAQTGKQVCTLGPIIHNRHAVAHFEKMGVRVIDSPEQATSDMTVIIRSHGVSKAVQETLEASGATVVDATCPFVKRIHGIVSRAEEEGRLPVIIGTRSHPEVEGIAGWCQHCEIFENVQELEKWANSGKIPADIPISMVCQTTSTESLWKSCEDFAKKVFTNLMQCNIIKDRIFYEV